MIFERFKKKKANSSCLTTDIHSHLIPGIDDGVQTIEESLEILKRLQTLGYQKVITTPHIMKEGYANTKEGILSGLNRLHTAVVESGIDIEIEAAAEYYLDDGFEALMKRKELLTIGGKYVLIETSYLSKPLFFEEIVFQLNAFGYRPILAHPERYRYIKDPENEYMRLKRLGIYFQVNINSFGGFYGKEAQKKGALFKSKWDDRLFGFRYSSSKTLRYT